MTATSLRHDLDGPGAGVVHVPIPEECHDPRVLFSTRVPRVLDQLAQSRRGAEKPQPGNLVTWWEGDVHVRVDLVIDAPSSPTGSSAPAQPAAPAAATPPVYTRPASRRQRRPGSGPLNWALPRKQAVARGLDLLLNAHPADEDADEWRGALTLLSRQIADAAEQPTTEAKAA